MNRQSPPRYFTAPLQEHLRALHAAVKQTRRLTDPERHARLVGNSLDRDLADDYTPQPHGLDVGSIGARFRDSLGPAIERARREQESAYLAALAETVDTFARQIEARRQELGALGGSSAFSARAREISDARARAHQRTA